MDAIFELLYYFKKAFLKLYDLRNESSSSAMIFLFVHSISIVFWRAESNFFFGILMHSNLYKLKFCAITLYVVAKKNEITIKVCSVSFSDQIFFSFFCKSSILLEGPMRFYYQTLMPLWDREARWRSDERQSQVRYCLNWPAGTSVSQLQRFSNRNCCLGP